ncbi:MAG: hypothetical protein ACJ71I_03455 [Nitrososphaeraceae archaeon]
MEYQDIRKTVYNEDFDLEDEEKNLVFYVFYKNREYKIERAGQIGMLYVKLGKDTRLPKMRGTVYASFKSHNMTLDYQSVHLII